jgi:hypothetical protein
VSKYGKPEDVARRRSLAAREERYTAILRFLAAHDRPLTPNQIGEAINADGVPVPPRAWALREAPRPRLRYLPDP